MDSNLFQISNTTSTGLSLQAIIASILYSLLGLFLMVAFIYMVDRIFQLNFRKELMEDHNVALGALFAGIAIAVSIIIASAIHG